MASTLLHDFWRSSAAYRVRIALNLKGVEYDRSVVDLTAGAQKDEAFRSRNPQGFVPMLERDGQKIGQSLAIIEYLDETHPEPPLLPRDQADRAHARALALAIACDIHPLNNLRVLKYLSGPLSLDEDTRSLWYAHWVREGLTALEAMAAPRAGRFLFGDTPTIADVCLVPQLYNARRFNVQIDDLPLLVRADAEANGLDAFAAAHPDKFAPNS